MPASFVAADTYYDAGTAWPTSLTITGAPSGTARGDRLVLVVLAYNTPTTLDNWNLGGDWTLLQSENGTAGVGGQRSSIHVYTARHQDGAPLPLTISPRTSGGTLITDPGGSAWYRAHLWAESPSYPIYLAGSPLEEQVILGRGQSVADQPNNWDGGYSGPGHALVTQFTALLNPLTRTLGTVSGSISTEPFVDQDAFAGVTGRGGQARIATAVAPTAHSGGVASYPQIGSGGSINVRAVLIARSADPDPPLPSPSRGWIRGRSWGPAA